MFESCLLHLPVTVPVLCLLSKMVTTTTTSFLPPGCGLAGENSLALRLSASTKHPETSASCDLRCGSQVRSRTSCAAGLRVQPWELNFCQKGNWPPRTPSGKWGRSVGSSEWPVASLQKSSVANKADRPLTCLLPELAILVRGLAQTKDGKFC